MHILIDECLPKKLKRELQEHTVFTVQEKGWSSIENGDLLRIAEEEFDVWADKGTFTPKNPIFSIFSFYPKSLVKGIIGSIANETI